MNVYDKAHELARELKDSQEFKDLKELNKKVMANPKHKELLDDFRQKAMKFQMDNIGKDKPEGLEEMQKLQNALMMNRELAEYLMVEMKFSQMFEDVHKIIMDSVKLD